MKNSKMAFYDSSYAKLYLTTYIGHHTLAVQRGLNLGVALFIVSEALFFLAIFWAFFHKLSTLWIGAKFRGNPKALITKLYKETYRVASLISGGTVTSLEILDINQGMGNRGSKPDSLISVKEQRVDGSSVFLNTVRCTLSAREIWFLCYL